MTHRQDTATHGPTRWRWCWLWLALAWSLGGLNQMASAATSPWHDDGFSKVRLISGAASLEGRREIVIGLHFELQKDWKVYWRSPGDAGYPPQLDWQGSRNLGAATIQWPLPERFSVIGLETLGYHDQVVLPLRLNINDPTAPVALRLLVDYLACAEVCVPLTAKLSLDIPAHGGASDAALSHLLGQWVARVPAQQPEDGTPQGGLSIEAAALLAQGKMLRVVARATPPLQAPDLYVEGPTGYFFAAPQVTLLAGGTRAVFDLAVGEQYPEAALSESALTLTLADGERGIERRLTLSPALPADLPPLASKTPTLAPGVLAILPLALLGGLILNLMPCVLPVLSLKILGFIGHGGGQRRRVTQGFLMTAAGIVVAFLLLASALVGLKLSGAAVGWGIQFQQPWFLALMILVVSLFAANLWGLFEIPLPRWLADAGTAKTTSQGLGGDFAAGVFATILATPCSAPFLGTAIGFALARGWAEIYLVFFFVGLGLALPYVLVALLPGLATRLPKPGRWMITLRKILGLALLATAVWLIWVLAALVSAVAVALTAALVVALLALFGVAKKSGRPAGGALWGAVAALVGAMVLVPLSQVRPGPAEPTLIAADAFADWQPFERAAIPLLVTQGNVVFVDVTADWCITCRVNKTLALSDPRVAEQLRRPTVIAMQADWTRPSDTISDYLASFGRYGIPFNVVYGPGAPSGIVLSELLDPEAVLAVLTQAAGSKSP